MTPPPLTVEEWAGRELYAAAMALRQSHDGSGDPLPHEDCATIRRVLAERVGTGWKPPLWPERARADDALREFVRAVLDETAPKASLPLRPSAAFRRRIAENPTPLRRRWS